MLTDNDIISRALVDAGNTYYDRAKYAATKGAVRRNGTPFTNEDVRVNHELGERALALAKRFEGEQ